MRARLRAASFDVATFVHSCRHHRDAAAFRLIATRKEKLVNSKHKRPLLLPFEMHGGQFAIKSRGTKLNNQGFSIETIDGIFYSFYSY